MRMASFSFLLALLFILPSASAAEPVTLQVINEKNRDQVMPQGKEVDAIDGDLVLSNGLVTAVIAQPLATRNANMTVREIGGCLIDLTQLDAQSDQLSCYYPGSRVYAFRSWSARDAAENPVVINESTQASHPQALEVVVNAAATEGRAALEVVYRLEAGASNLIIEQTYFNPNPGEVEINLSDDIRYDSGKEDARRSPNGKSPLVYVDDVYWQQCYGVASPGKELTSRSDSRYTIIRYGSGSRQPDLVLKKGEQFRNTVELFCAPNLSRLEELYSLASHGSAATSCTFHALQKDKSVLDGVPHVRIELTRDGQYAGTLWTDGSGRVDCKLLPGDYEATVSYLNLPLLEKQPLKVGNSREEFKLSLPLTTGVLAFQYTDPQGNPIPCKVELQPKDPALKGTLSFGPETAIQRVKNLCYLISGKDEVLLPTGSYDLIVSHGPEYDALFLSAEVTADGKTESKGTLKRVLDTKGWVSTEFHSHSSPSGDNTSHQMGRVHNLVCEHLEYAPCTEHNRISTYDHHLTALNATHLMGTCTGMELTGSPLPLNHQNVFPLIHRPGQQDGGAPITDLSPEVQIQRVALWDNRSEKLVQQNHPDIGWLFYDKDGNQVPDEGHSASFPFIDVMEIHPLSGAISIGTDVDSSSRIRNNRIFNWFQLLNQGFRIKGVVNTDAHYNFHGSGPLRNWVKCSTDDPAQISTPEIVQNCKQGQIIMSNGPFLSVTVQAAGDKNSSVFGPGDEFLCSSGDVVLDVKVQCPNWCDIDRVSVFVNGKRIPELDRTRESHPDQFQSGATKFEQKLSYHLSGDAHIIVLAAGEKSQLGPVMGPAEGKDQPAALSNPVFVDVDGKSFQANKDVLDDALPVKDE